MVVDVDGEGEHGSLNPPKVLPRHSKDKKPQEDEAQDLSQSRRNPRLEELSWKPGKKRCWRRADEQCQLVECWEVLRSGTGFTTVEVTVDQVVWVAQWGLGVQLEWVQAARERARVSSS